MNPLDEISAIHEPTNNARQISMNEDNLDLNRRIFFSLPMLVGRAQDFLVLAPLLEKTTLMGLYQNCP
jgi:hypothetical protein